MRDRKNNRKYDKNDRNLEYLFIVLSKQSIKLEFNHLAVWFARHPPVLQELH